MFDSRIDGRNDSDEYLVSGLEVLSDDLQHARVVGFPSQRDIKVPRLELEQARQKLSVIHLRALGRIPVRSRAGVNSDTPALFLGKAAEREIIELDETVEQHPGRIDLHRQAALGEIDLDLVRAFRETPADLLFMLSEQIVDEFLPRVAGKILRRIHKA